MHTQAEIKTLWCPMVRMVAMTSAGGVDNGQPVFNRGSITQGGDTKTAIPHGANCIGKACAMFRLDVKPFPKAVDITDPFMLQQITNGEKPTMAGYDFVPDFDDDGPHFVETEAHIEARRLGYCGLAGKR